MFASISKTSMVLWLDGVLTFVNATLTLCSSNPDVFRDSPEIKDWTDSRFIDGLKAEQAKGYVNT